MDPPNQQLTSRKFGRISHWSQNFHDGIQQRKTRLFQVSSDKLRRFGISLVRLERINASHGWGHKGRSEKRRLLLGVAIRWVWMPTVVVTRNLPTGYGWCAQIGYWGGAVGDKISKQWQASTWWPAAIGHFPNSAYQLWPSTNKVSVTTGWGGSQVYGETLETKEGGSEELIGYRNNGR